MLNNGATGRVKDDVLLEDGGLYSVVCVLPLPHITDLSKGLLI